MFFRGDSSMLVEYINEALRRAEYKMINDDEPFYGEIPVLEGVWSTGKTLEECRKNLIDVLDGWIYIRLKKGLDIPKLGSFKISELKRLKVSA
ncbi:MAG: type II toxin-antitoxin system HicB family antitoxin [Candidatus Hydrogenedentota bacterium]